MVLAFGLEKASRVIVIWGSNRFVDCLALLASKTETVLSVSAAPLEIDLLIPDDVPTNIFRILRNRVVSSPGPSSAQIASTEKAVAVLWNEIPVLMAQDIGREQQNPFHDRILLHIDFRPFGLNVFDDAAGIHIGGGLIGRSAFSHCSAAITLG